MNSLKYILSISIFIYSMVRGAAHTALILAAAVARESTNDVVSFDPLATKLLWNILRQQSLNIDALEKVLSTGKVDTNKRSESGYTPLGHVVTCVENEEIVVSAVKLLIKYGADPLLQRNPYFPSDLPIHWAIQRGNINLMDLLLSSNTASQVNVPDHRSYTPLMLVVCSPRSTSGRLENALGILLHKGADLFAKNRQGEDVLTQAIKQKESYARKAVYYARHPDHAVDEKESRASEENMKEVIKFLEAEKYNFNSRRAQRQKALKEALLASPEMAALPPGLLPLISSYIAY